MKGLKALEKLRQNIIDNSHLFDDELLKTIEKELKALEIIKNALIKNDDLELSYYANYLKTYYYIRIYAQVENDGEFFEEELTPEEYDLLKEVLTDGTK